jgi:CheY-like chemotaxis protein
MTQGKKVLIVDDEPPIRVILTRWLTGWGYGVRDVGGAVEALDVMATEPADIVLCDINMPEHDGLWLAEQVHAQWPQTAIVMSTGRDDPPTVRTSRRLGAVAYVLKPFDPVLLREALDLAAGRSHVRPSAEPS